MSDPRASKPTWSPGAVRMFELLFRPWMHFRIASVLVRGSLDSLHEARRVILVANHVSWWDGFLLRELHRRSGAPCPLFTVMHQRQLVRFPFFRAMGVLEVDGSPGGIRTLRRRLTELPGAFWLAYFPQGSIWPSWRRPLGFARGVEMVVEATAPCVVVPVALHLEPLQRPAPTAFVRVGTPRRIEGRIQAGDLERDVTTLLDELHASLARHGEASPDVWTSSSLQFPTQ